MAKTPSTSSRSRKDRQSNVVPMVRSRAAAEEAPATQAAVAAVDPAQRQRWIAERAYLLAEQRGFAPGGELGDWLAAEREVDATLRAST